MRDTRLLRLSHAASGVLKATIGDDVVDAATITAQIKELANLKERGLLTEAQFEKKKKRYCQGSDAAQPDAVIERGVTSLVRNGGGPIDTGVISSRPTV